MKKAEMEDLLNLENGKLRKMAHIVADCVLTELGRERINLSETTLTDEDEQFGFLDEFVEIFSEEIIRRLLK